MFPAERSVEVDLPGLASPNLANFDWKYVQRPFFPIDGNAATGDRSRA